MYITPIIQFSVTKFLTSRRTMSNPVFVVAREQNHVPQTEEWGITLC